MDARRGSQPEDIRNFSDEAIPRLKEASKDVCYLLDRGYDAKSAVTFVGNHFQLSERQRLAVMRSTAPGEKIELRKSKLVCLSSLKGKRVSIDGFNLIITLEVMLCGSPLFICMDGAVRDLASLRGTYRIIPETEGAVDQMLDTLEEAGVSGAEILLDEPVSNSGRLKTFIREKAEERACSRDVPDIEINICRNVDKELYGRELVITSDSVILDKCVSWVDLTRECMKKCGAGALKVWE
jgi:hypothetical protein